MRATLDAATARANRLGGRTEAAVWIDGWDTPAVSGSTGQMRMWSMSKPVAAVAVRRLALAAGRAVPSAVEDAIQRAIQRSENCRQRHVVLELQQLAGGPASAASAVAQVLQEAGAAAHVASIAETADPMCRDYLLRAAAGIGSPLRPALLLGTSTWTIRDAAAFAHALADGRFGKAGAEIAQLMRQPKQPSEETPPGDYTAPLGWGAGRVLRKWNPAYKAGWGGTLHGNFLAGQIAFIDFHGVHVALAAAFHPNNQPDRDDPGQTAAPAAIEQVFQAVADQLEQGRQAKPLPAASRVVP
jgi:hypothetical protein